MDASNRPMENFHDVQNPAMAVVILIDNSNKSIDGDFGPNRLDAQKMAAERIIADMHRNNQNSQVSIGSLAREGLGVIASPTKDRRKLSTALQRIKPGGPIQLFQGIKCAFLALHHRNIEEIKQQRVIVFVGSKYTLSQQQVANLANAANTENVAVDIIVFGNDVENTDVLEDFVSRIMRPSNLFFIGSGKGISLSNEVILMLRYKSVLGNPQPLTDDEQAIQMAMYQSLKDQEDQSYLDVDVQMALAASLLEKSHVTNNNQETQDDNNDPDLLEAIELSKQSNNNNKTNDKTGDLYQNHGGNGQ